MFLSSAKPVCTDKNTVATPVYVIAKDCAATGIILKELYSTSVEYSANLLDTIQLDGAEYRIYVFLVNKNLEKLAAITGSWRSEQKQHACHQDQRNMFAVSAVRQK